MRRVFVPLRQPDIDKLVELARENRRRPQDQAAYFIEQALRESARRKPASCADSEAPTRVR